MPENVAEIEALVIGVLRTCFDPEIPVNIYELGLIYDVKVDPSGHVGIQMTLTSPLCPVAASLPVEVEDKLRVLYIENQPRWEYRFLKTMLVREPTIASSLWLDSALGSGFAQEGTEPIRALHR